MKEMAEGGASLAWRLLATLEGGSLLLATSALLAYSARKRVSRNKRTRKPVRNVLLTNTTNILGKELKERLESRGCIIHTIPDEASRETSSVDLAPSEISGSSEIIGATDISGASETSQASEKSEADHRVDALVIVGAFSPPKTAGLQGMAQLVSEDVYCNLNLLERLSQRVELGGRMAWACAGAGAKVPDAFDAVLSTNLHHIATRSHCEPVWVGRGQSVQQTAERIVEALLSTNDLQSSGFSIRNAAQKVGEYLCRWLKIVT